MNMFKITIKSLVHKPLSSLLSIILFGFGVAIITMILLTSKMLKSEIEGTAQGIDLVVGAKGSPLQIILASVFHIDYPTGNISLKDASKLANNRLIASAIPISLGDNYQGFRIVGTTKAYADLYKVDLIEGIWFDAPMTAVIGHAIASKQNLQIGDEFSSAHGLDEGGGDHGETPFVVSGVLKKSGTVLDNLILVSIHSVWAVHAHHEEGIEEHHVHADSNKLEIKKLGVFVSAEEFEENEITAMLVDYRSPMAAVQLPRLVNATSNLQAASPAFETARLFDLISVGVDVANILGIIVIILSAISVFIALINSLKERKYELAIMRSIGASRFKIFILILGEGILLSITGLLFGFLLSHIGFYTLILSIDKLDVNPLLFVGQEMYVFLSGLIVGIFASIFPAFMAYTSDISDTLSKA